jgi:hypothetical protein
MTAAQGHNEMAQAVVDHLSKTNKLLTAHDRCDVQDCGAQAYVRVLLKTGDLLFCGHHFTANQSVIDQTALAVYDARSLIGSDRLDVSA